MKKGATGPSQYHNAKLIEIFPGFFNAAVAGFRVATVILVIAGILLILASFILLPSQVFIPLLVPLPWQSCREGGTPSLQLCQGCLIASSMLLVTLLLLAYLQLLAVP
jgi:hypothetical protein